MKIACIILTLATFCGTSTLAQNISIGERMVFTTCHVEVVEVSADSLGPDIYNVPWLEDVVVDENGVPHADPDIKIGTCVGACLQPMVMAQLNCIPVGYRPVRIEAHTVNPEGENEVVFLYVYVPSECDCKSGPGKVIGSYYLSPLLDNSLSQFSLNLHGADGKGGGGLKGLLGMVPELEGKTQTFIDLLIQRIGFAIAFDGGTSEYLEASLGQIPMTSALQAEIEAWLWGAFSAAFFDIFDELELSMSSQTFLVNQLKAQYPSLFN